MTCPKIIYRVAGDSGPPLTVVHRGLITTGLTITARFKKDTGEVYALTATVDVVGDGGDTPAEYHFDFSAANLTAGQQEFDLNYAGVSIDDYSIPNKAKLIMKVRA